MTYQTNQDIARPTAGPIALVVDDHALFRAGISAMLKSQCGMATVLEAGSLDAGLKVLGDVAGISLAIFDLAMPGMVSAACMRAVRETFPDVRVVVMTGSNRREDILVALQAGVHGFIIKTLGREDVCAALLHILRGQIYVPPDLAIFSDSDKLDLSGPSLGMAPEAKLTPRQHAVFELLKTGRTNKEIARAMNLSENTIKVHANAIYRTLEVPNRRSLSASIRDPDTK